MELSNFIIIFRSELRHVSSGLDIPNSCCNARVRVGRGVVRFQLGPRSGSADSKAELRRRLVFGHFVQMGARRAVPQVRSNFLNFPDGGKENWRLLDFLLKLYDGESSEEDFSFTSRILSL